MLKPDYLADYRSSLSIRRLVRVAIAAGLFMVVIILAWCVASRIELLRSQQWLMRFSDPPTMVVYEEDSKRAEVLVRSNRVYEDLGDVAECGTRRSDPQQWLTYPVKQISGAIVFLHERSVGNAPARLVVVGVGFSLMGDTHVRTLQWQVISLATLTKNPSILRSTRMFAGDTFPISGNPPMRMFAGQADAGDSSHFTIVYEIGTQHGIIDGWLQMNDTIVMSLRNGQTF